MAENNLQDKNLVCKDCKRHFIFTVKEQMDFGQKGWNDPVRCRYCRRQKKILNLVLDDKTPISDEVSSTEVCDKCRRPFYTKIKRKHGINLYCDDCWAEIKYGKTGEKGESVEERKA